jgi:tetratricopeptide (TPR) repeat protein
MGSRIAYHDVAGEQSMITTTPSERNQRSARQARGWRLLTGVVMIAVLVGCAGKTEAELATEELNAGLAASAANQEDQAKAHYEACLKHNPQNEFCIYNLGVIADRNGNALEAEIAYRQALLINPTFPSAMFNLAVLRAAAGSNDEAMALYRKFIELRPEVAGGHLNLGLLLRAAGQIEEGDKELAEAVRLDPSIILPSFPAPSASPTSKPSESPAAS